MHIGPWIFLRNFVILIPILAAETSIMLAIGASRPNFDWTDPKEMAGGVTGCLGGLAAWSFMAMALAVMSLGLAIPVLFGLSPLVGAAVWALVTGASAGVMALTITFAAERLAVVEM
jgi:hypothetical protein